MSLEKRQQRLADILGRQSDLCFQVYVLLERYEISKEEYDILSKKYRKNTDDQYICLPQHDIGKHTVVGGFLDGGEAMIYTPELIYTGLACSEIYAKQNCSIIIEQYTDEILNHFPDRGMPSSKDLESFIDDDGDRVLTVNWVVQPYALNLCHPRDLGVLKPITLIDGHVIQPNIERIDDLAHLRRAEYHAVDGLKP